MEATNKAIPFITNVNGDFEVTEESKEFLRKLTGKKIGVICVVGKYRTGKSYFLNKVILDLQDSNSGFNVGPTINPCTKGLWIWDKTIKKKLKSGEEIEMIVMDCEGFGGMDENSNHDTRIFLFAILLSSYFIYNSLGTIDENALQTLSLIINLAKDIKSKSVSPGSLGEDQASPENFPSFLWVLRDFSLRMVDERGDKITPKMYLENALANQKGCSEATDKKNRIRRLLRHFFKERDCITMVRPVEIERELQKLNTLQKKYLRKEFVQQMDQARTKIFKKAKDKKLNCKSITGEMFLHLAKAYTETVNSGRVPNIESAWNYICKEKVEEAASKALSQVDAVFNSEEVKKMMAEGDDWKGYVKKKLMKEFKAVDFGNKEAIDAKIEQLEEGISVRMKKLEEGVRHDQGKKAKKWLVERFQPLMDLVNQDKISDVDSYERMVSQIREEFEVENDNVNHKELKQMFNEFKQDKQTIILGSIMRAKDRETQKISHKNEAEIEKLRSENNHLKDTFDVQTENLREKLQNSEQRRYQLEAEIQTYHSKIENLENKYQFEQERILEKQKSLKSEYKDKNLELESELKNLRKRCRDLELSETEHKQARVKYEQMFIQEKELSKKKFEIYENEISGLRKSLKATESDNEDLKSKCKKYQKSKEVENLRTEIEELRSKKRNQDSQLGNLRMEKQYLDSKIQFLNGQIEEGKKIHETLLKALQSQLNNEENSSANQIFATNKNLVGTLTKAEARIKKLEGKLQRYKIYKKVVQNVSAVQLKNNSKILPIKTAMQIIQSSTGCGGDLIDGVCGLNDCDDFSNLTNIENEHPDCSSPSKGSHSVSIVHTIVKEDPETSKVFTEYIIEIKEDKFGGKKWNITRKYKDFVELHHKLLNKFPDIEFPSSTNQILGFTPSIAAWMSNKRRSVIEDRRKALENYLNEILKIYEIFNSKVLRKFIDMDGDGDDASSVSTTNYRGFYNNNANGMSNLGERSLKEAKNNSHSHSSKLFGKFDFSKFSEKSKYFRRNGKSSKKRDNTRDFGKSGEKIHKRGDSSSYKFRSGKPMQKYGEETSSPFY